MLQNQALTCIQVLLLDEGLLLGVQGDGDIHVLGAVSRKLWGVHHVLEVRHVLLKIDILVHPEPVAPGLERVAANQGLVEVRLLEVLLFDVRPQQPADDQRITHASLRASPVREQLLQHRQVKANDVVTDHLVGKADQLKGDVDLVVPVVDRGVLGGAVVDADADDLGHVVVQAIALDVEVDGLHGGESEVNVVVGSRLRDRCLGEPTS
jgi:hypothetical protein